MSDAMCKAVLQRLWQTRRFDPKGKLKFATKAHFGHAVRTSPGVKSWHISRSGNYFKQRIEKSKPHISTYALVRTTTIEKVAQGCLETVHPWFDIYPDKEVIEIARKSISELKLLLCSLALLDGRMSEASLCILITCDDWILSPLVGARPCMYALYRFNLVTCFET